MHSDFDIRWSEIMSMGLRTEERDTLIKKYPVPENCTFLKPPKLNVEVDRAITDVARFRDKRILDKQQLLAACLVAIGKTIQTLLDNEKLLDVLVLENLSDSCKLVVDAMHDETAVRRSLILAYVNTSIRGILEKTVSDEYLFGKTLPEDLKAAKIIHQSAEELKFRKAPPPKT